VLLLPVVRLKSAFVASAVFAPEHPSSGEVATRIGISANMRRTFAAEAEVLTFVFIIIVY
jgi:hypothetical protein